MAHSDLEHAKDEKDGSDSSVHESEAHLGVRSVEATHRVYGKYSKWFLFLGLALAAYIYSLDGQTTYTYLAYATSSFSDHSLLSSVQVAQSIIIACGKPVVAKLADVTSRGQAYALVCCSYVLGYIIIASAHSLGAIAGGIIFYAIGYTGLQLLTQIIIADITTLKWRGLVSSLISLPFVVNAFVGANISTQIIERSGWRWGYGMFAILIPTSLAPLIVTLLWAERKAKKLGLVKRSQSNESFFTRAIAVFHELDVFGLLLIGTSVALFLLPLTLAEDAKGRWHNASMIAMLVVGIVLMPAVVLYEWRIARYPVIPFRFLRNRAVVFASLIGFFDFISFYLTYTYLYSFILVTKDWPLIHVTYFSECQSVALTVFGILAGIIMSWTKRYKTLQTIGLCIRLLGVGLMIHSRGAKGTTAEIVWTQILQGIGGGFAATTTQVGAQASVPHADVAIVTAVVLLLTEIGGAIGTAVSGAIWTNLMPGQLAKHLPFLNATEVAEIFGSVTIAASYPEGDPTREGVIDAYGQVMKTMLIIATVIAIFPIIFSLLMPDYLLGDKQNAVDQKDLAGHDTASVEPHSVIAQSKEKATED